MSAHTSLDPAAIEQVTGRLLTDMAATAGLQMIHIGIRTGLWKALTGGEALSPADVAARAGVAEPYAREWLKHQAVSGYVEYDPATDRFTLPAAVAAVLADDAQSGLVEGFASMLARWPPTTPSSNRPSAPVEASAGTSGQPSTGTAWISSPAPAWSRH